MRIVKPNSLLSVKNGTLLAALYLMSGSASAEYYMAGPALTQTVVVTQSASPCRVYRDYKCERRVAYRCQTGCRTRSVCNAPRRARCSTATVRTYYTAPVCNTWSSCNPCGGCNTVVMQSPGFNVVYGPAVYAPDTYNPYYYYYSDWDLRTSDDYYY